MRANTPQPRYGWSEEHNAYIGAVVIDGIVVTIGMMPTEERIKAWLEDAIAREAWVDASELPDMYDEASIH